MGLETKQWQEASGLRYRPRVRSLCLFLLNISLSLSLYFFLNLSLSQNTNKSGNKNRMIERIPPAELICTKTVTSEGVSQSHCVKQSDGLTGMSDMI